MYTIKKQNLFLLVSKEAGLGINSLETKYMFTSHQRNLGKNHGIKKGNKTFETVANFKHLPTTIKTKILQIAQ
jgi:hypothetical protein